MNYINAQSSHSAYSNTINSSFVLLYVVYSYVYVILLLYYFNCFYYQVPLLHAFSKKVEIFKYVDITAVVAYNFLSDVYNPMD